jgi:hypothetical protein
MVAGRLTMPGIVSMACRAWVTWLAARMPSLATPLALLAT